MKIKFWPLYIFYVLLFVYKFKLSNNYIVISKIFRNRATNVKFISKRVDWQYCIVETNIFFFDRLDI